MVWARPEATNIKEEKNIRSPPPAIWGALAVGCVDETQPKPRANNVTGKKKLHRTSKYILQRACARRGAGGSNASTQPNHSQQLCTTEAAQFCMTHTMIRLN